MRIITSKSILGLGAVAWLSLSLSACRQSLLGTQSSQGLTYTYSELESAVGAQQAFVAAQASFISVVGSGQAVLTNGGLLSDELTALEGDSYPQYPLDGRYTVYSEGVNAGYSGIEGPTDYEFEQLLYTRSQLLLSVGSLVMYEPAGRQSLAGEAYALAGYAELYMAEDYCPGVTLDRALPGSGVQFGTPLSTDSLLGDAIGQFDSALKHVGTPANDTVIYLADVGLGRAWLDRDSLSGAARAVENVPLGFAYNLTYAPVPAGGGNSLQQSTWAGQGLNATQDGVNNWNVADRDGGVGINFISGHDARLALDSSGITYDFGYDGLPDSVFYYPLKFGPIGQSTSIPIATGVEAALIAAEAAGDSSGGSLGAMLMQLQSLRNSAAETYLPVSTPLPTMTPDSMAAQGAEAISILFRERAFWLFGLGTRLGDMRREVRQYNSLFNGVANAINAIYPNGPYAQYAAAQAYGLGGSGYGEFTFSTYGPDIDFPLPTQASTGQVELNPAYQGCTSPTTVP